MNPSAPTTGPLVSVIIPAYNAGRYLESAVRSVLEQTHRPFELFIVDDGSNDDTLLIARRLATCDPASIFVLQHPHGKNRGVAESRNLALAAAKGTYVAFLDADDSWYRNKLSVQVAFMEEHPEIGLSFTKSRILRHGDGQRFIPGVEELGNVPPVDHKTALIQIIMLSLNYIFSTVMVRTDCIRSVGGFPEGLSYQSEDRIMVAKVSADHGIALVPEVLCEYLAHDSNYSVGAVRGGIVPAIFFEMRVRIIKWLHDENGKRDWASSIAGKILPDSFVAALLCSRQERIRKNVMHNLIVSLRLFPMLLPSIVAGCMRHSRIGAAFRSVRNRVFPVKPEDLEAGQAQSKSKESETSTDE